MIVNMANSYNWTFDPIEVRQTADRADVVHEIHWRLNATSEDNWSAAVYGRVGCGDPDDDFIEFDSADFTDDLVKGWVIAGIGQGVTEGKLIKAVDDQIAKAKVQRLFDEIEWRLAKTMPEIPHWYTRRGDWESEETFEWVVSFVQKNNKIGQFKYWTSNGLLKNTIIINKRKA